MNKSFLKLNLLALFVLISGSLMAQVPVSNVLLGTNTGNSISTGSYNTILGHDAGKFINSGSKNVLLGGRAGHNKKTNIGGVYIGYYSGFGGTSGDYTIAIGYEAARGGTGSENISLGHQAGYGSNGNGNVFIGKRTGIQNTLGNNNVMIGKDAGSGANANGSNNIFIGANAGKNEAGDSKLHISNNSATLIYGDFNTLKVGINNTAPQYDLDVCGIIRSEELIIETGWCDFVFYDNYKLSSLEEEATFIEENGHLDGFESEKQMDGKLEIADLTKRQQLKIEEIMLHLIQINEEVKSLKAENTALKTQLDELSK